MNRKNLVLVDFDGVVLRNPQASKYISNKANAYVARTCKLAPNCKSLESLNKELYGSYGHTVIGLNKHGINASLKDFNKFMYDDVSKYRHIVMSSEEKEAWLAFMEAMDEMDLDVRFFSNASAKWINHFMGDLVDTQTFELQHIFESYKNEPRYDEMLKPERSIYDLVMHKYPQRIYYMLDDKLHNFQAISHDPRWVKIWMNGCNESSWMVQRKLTASFFALDKLKDASELIHRFEG